ncbi:phytanoyl-CoA dioxygenase family protein [Falsiroseomonas sp. CW058]|uniref:phytanoyl-CoA dioxygenase family protein n=1 Tax=Falsiroseomonas sp. CW058 TaxID=3388664 RepID=UPI003D3171D5
MTRGEMREAWARDGIFTVPDLLTAAEVATLKAEAAAICRGERGAVDGLPEDRGGTDDEVTARCLAIHFPHKLSRLVRDTCAHPRIVEVLREVIGPNVKAMQTMMFVKHAGKPGQAWHQDENFIPTRDRSLAAAWIALDDATVENGCLWAHPGSHRSGVLWPDAAHGDARFDAVKEATSFPYPREGGVALPVRAGGVVFFHGHLLHRSLPNVTRAGFRRALVTHYMSAESLLPWDMGGRIPATKDMRDILMVAGEDPHAHKGVADIARPFVRAEAGATAWRAPAMS